MKSNRGQGFKKAMQKGFTLVELAIVLVIAGIILVGVLKGTDSINKAKVERAVADLKGLQASILEFQKRNNRLPGDCNNDGIIALNPPIVAQILNTATATTANIVPDSVERIPSGLGVCGLTSNVVDLSNNDQPNTETPSTAGITATSGVAVSFAIAPDTATTSFRAVSNLVWDELRRAGVVDGNRTNLELAKHLQQDVFLVGAMQDQQTATQRANVIVMYGIPVWLAEAIDAEIDGVAQNYADRPASTGRVRLWADNAALLTASNNKMLAPAFTSPAHLAYLPTAQPAQYGTDRDALVSISFQFDTMKLSN
jgi:prepilin-type N-terminal cleavage/methylation domain-containing protein